jgi:hypothetical protein
MPTCEEQLALLEGRNAAQAEAILRLQAELAEAQANAGPARADINLGTVRIKPIGADGVASHYEITSPDGSVATVPAAASGDTELRMIGTIAAAQMMAAAGGAPAWVPENAKLHINFAETNRGAWTEASGEVAIDTLVGNDPLIDSEWGSGTSGYDPSDLTAAGLTTSDILGFIGEAKTRLLSGSTGVIEWLLQSEAGTADFLVFVDAVGSFNAIDFFMSRALSRMRATSSNGALSLTSNQLVLSVGARNRIAFTATPTRLEFSVNGNAALSASLTTDDWSAEGMIAALMDLNADTLVTFTSYDTLPSTTGLSDLSALS